MSSLLPVLFLTLFTLCLTQKIAFPKFGNVAGYTKYDPAGLSDGVAIAGAPDNTLPKQFRSHAKKKGGFTYTHPVPPGQYDLTLGFAEFSQSACVKGKRVFTVDANGLTTPPIDVFDAVGCNAAHTVNLADVTVGAGGLVLTLDPVSSFAPYLANFMIEPVGGASNPPASPGPSPDEPPPDTAPVGEQGLVDGISVVKVDVGGGSDRRGDLEGQSRVFSNVFDIEGTEKDAKFSKNRYGKNFTYVINVQPRILYHVNLYFAEAYKPACKPGARVFDVSAADSVNKKKVRTISNLDVYSTVGCRAAYTTALKRVRVFGSGVMVINFAASKNNAMISAFEIVTNDPSYSAIPSPSPIDLGPSATDVNLNCGVNDKPPKGTRRSSTTRTVSGTANAPGPYYKTARYGSDFTYKFNLAPGAYDIILGFSEYFDPRFCSEPGKRVFNVYVNDQIQLEGYDIYAETGCFKGVEAMLQRQSVSAVDIKPLTIRFESVVNRAQINFISIKPAKEECNPASFTGGLAEGEDHAAHAIPGTYPPQLNANSPRSYVDSDGDGFVRVEINGDGSHSHFFDAANNIIGVITDYTWSIVETGEVVSRKEKFMYNFPLGTTRLKLSVIDNSCTTDESETTVTVTGAIQPGQYCYYYTALSEPLLGGTLLDNPRPQYASVSNSLKLGFPDFSFKDTLFSARCFFFLEIDADMPTATVSISTGGTPTGIARVYKGEDVIIDTNGGNSAETALAVGLIGFEVIYERTTLAANPKLVFKVDNAIPGDNKIFYDRRTVLPILSTVTPSDGPDTGGTRVKINGYGLFQPLTVKFGAQTVSTVGSSSKTQFFVNSPPRGGKAVVDITATTSTGLESNPVSFSYGSTCDSVKFDETSLTTNKGEAVDFLELPTCAVIGQDGRIYMGTLGATVQVIGYDVEKLTTTSHCYSKALIDNDYQLNGVPSVRDILGIAFNPRDTVERPYISTSTLFWHDKNRVDRSNKKAWQNGAIDRLKPGTDPTDGGVCLVYDKRIVSGLPVSNHDHSVNGLMFAQNGNILVAVGGYTNMGLPGYKLGNFWETTLAATILEVKVTKADFDGEIKYSNIETPRLSQKTSGDVDIYCTGLRNTFAMAMTRQGEIYASDQGPNCSFGDTATSCGDYSEAEAEQYDTYADVNWPGQVNHGWKSCPPTSISRPDKMLHITKNAWYGHPNIQRGGDECAWIDPFDHLTADDKAAPAIYKKPLVTLESSITGMSEYGAQHFCGKLRGELIMSTYKGGTTYRMGVNGDKVTSGPDEISGTGGITFVENAHGDLIFPRLTQKNVFVMRPRAAHAGVFVINAVPFRHGKAGGTNIVIGGVGFGAVPSVTIGGKGCAVVRSSDKEIVCKVPSGQGKKDVVVTADGGSSTLENGVLYMSV